MAQRPNLDACANEHADGGEAFSARPPFAIVAPHVEKKVGAPMPTPAQLRDRYVADLPKPLRQHPLVAATAKRLKTLPPVVASTVCHGDLNHKNWLLSDAHKLYLVDWDQASLGDPAFDLSVVLINYVPRAQWGTWLEAYGTHLTDDLLARIMWYGQLHLLEAVRSGYNQQRYTEMNQCFDPLASAGG